MSHGQELDIVTLEPYIRFGEQGGFPGILHPHRHAVGGRYVLLWSSSVGSLMLISLPAVRLSDLI